MAHAVEQHDWSKPAALALFNKTGITTGFVNLEEWPEDWKTNAPAVIQFFCEHQYPSFEMPNHMQ